MSTPTERIQTILSNIVTSKVKFTATIGNNGRLYFIPQKTEEFKMLPNEDTLQRALGDLLRESWNVREARYECPLSVWDVLAHIKRRILAEYHRRSERCNATKRKTEQFVNEIALDNTILANYLFSMYLEIRSAAWDSRPKDDKAKYFETLESLRRVYGKRK